MRRYFVVVFGLLCSYLPCRCVKAGESAKQKFKFGLVNRLTFRKSHSRIDTDFPTGFFFNYALSRKISMEMEYEKLKGTAFPREQAENENYVDKMMQRNWSASVAINYHLKPIQENLSPFVGLGVGQYYIYDSKNKVKSGGEHPGQCNWDYELRRSLRRSGFFGAIGLQYVPSWRTIFFIQTKCSILFNRGMFVPAGTSNFTDFINISTGLRFNLN